jgi:molybdopterin synthase catalytic subunit
VLLHRVGGVPIGESAVVVVVSSPHRPDAFAAARFCIDAVKASVPIWKRESWDGGESWGLEAQHLVDARAVVETEALG